MATQDYVMYAILAFIIIVMMFIIYKSRESKKEEFHEITESAEKMTVEKEEFTNIAECPCADDATDCPLGCSCSACAFEPFMNTEETAPIYQRMSNPSAYGSGGAIKKTTTGGDPFRGDLVIKSPPLSSSLNVPVQKSLALEKGGRNIVF